MALADQTLYHFVVTFNRCAIQGRKAMMVRQVNLKRILELASYLRVHYNSQHF